MLDDYKNKIKNYFYQLKNEMHDITVNDVEKSKKDVSNYVICLLDNQDIDIFEMKAYHFTQDKKVEQVYRVYRGIFSSSLAMEKCFISNHQISSLEQCEVGEIFYFPNGTYAISNCKIIKKIPFDKMRAYMYFSEELRDFVMGKASDEEILETFRYSQKFFHDSSSLQLHL